MINLTNEQFGRLTVIERTANRGKQPYWQCICTCGNVTTVRGSSLRCGDTTSCGCFQAEQTKKRRTTHGAIKNGVIPPEYNAWSNMRHRCNDVNNKDYHYYGGRGISYTPRWSKFENFINDMGDKPTLSHTLERHDNNRGYCPCNCYWATMTQQANNRRSNTIVNYK